MTRRPFLPSTVGRLAALGLCLVLVGCTGGPAGSSERSEKTVDAPGAVADRAATSPPLRISPPSFAPTPTLTDAPAVTSPPSAPTPEPTASARATPAVRAAGSTVRQQSFFSPALGEEMRYLVYLPPDYDSSTASYPTLYLLHGVAGDSEEWPSIGIPDAADRLIAGDLIRPLVIVFPYANASYYVNGATSGRRWEDYLVRDLIGSVDQEHRTLTRPERRAVGGLSMGGDGALQLAMRHPDVFGVAGAHSPSSRLLFENAPADVYGDEGYFRDRNPFWLAQAAPGAAHIKIWIDVGDEDPWRWNARAIHGALEARGIAHEFRLWAGIHDGDYWTAHIDDYLRYYDRALAAP